MKRLSVDWAVDDVEKASRARSDSLLRMKRLLEKDGITNASLRHEDVTTETFAKRGRWMAELIPA